LAKNLKLNIKNTQIAQAIDLGSLKSKLTKSEPEEVTSPPSKPEENQDKGSGAAKLEVSSTLKVSKEEPVVRAKARSKSAFAPSQTQPPKAKSDKDKIEAKPKRDSSRLTAEKLSLESELEETPKRKTSEELRMEIFGEDMVSSKQHKPERQHVEPLPESAQKAPSVPSPMPEAKISQEKPKAMSESAPQMEATHPERHGNRTPETPRAAQSAPEKREHVKLGPTGRHVNDLLPRRPAPKAPETPPRAESTTRPEPSTAAQGSAKPRPKAPESTAKPATSSTEASKTARPPKAKEFRDIKPVLRKTEPHRSFDARDRQGLRTSDEDRTWRKRRPKQHHRQEEDLTVRPTSLKVRIPITIKDLAVEMKLKASQLVAKLFMQGMVATLNDYLEDETTIQLLGSEFGCEITIDSSEEQRLRITDKSIKEEILEADEGSVTSRPPIVAFMGHVDHGKTSLIDSIRKSNRAAGEAGAITQHIGAFKCHTSVGDIAILDTPGHEAFSAMRARGADVTDIVVLVVAGDEGIRLQTIEAIQHAKSAKVTIVVAINKCDKPNFDQELVYRQLAEQDLLPEAWGGQTIAVNCSATTGVGIQHLLEMLALQAEVLELKAYPGTRARGSVLESEMHKGMGSVATVLVQNGTLRIGDPLVFGQTWGRVKTMRDEHRRDLKEAGPSTPVEITGLSGLPEAGEEFIVVKTEREARDIAEGRMQGIKQTNLQMKKKLSVENLFQQATDGTAKKVLNLILRADVQGSLEALKAALQKIESKKAEINIIFAAVGEVSESDVQLAAASKAVIVGFHTQIESHAEVLIKQLGVQVRMHDIIYHAVDDTKVLLAGTLDRIAIETEKGKAEIKAIFKSSQHGSIAGAQVIEGSLVRKHQARVRRNDEVIWKGSFASLKRVKEDVSEITKGMECGILLNGFNAYMVGDIVESYETTYITQEL